MKKEIKIDQQTIYEMAKGVLTGFEEDKNPAHKCTHVGEDRTFRGIGVETQYTKGLDVHPHLTESQKKTKIQCDGDNKFAVNISTDTGSFKMEYAVDVMKCKECNSVVETVSISTFEDILKVKRALCEALVRVLNVEDLILSLDDVTNKLATITFKADPTRIPKTGKFLASMNTGNPPAILVEETLKNVPESEQPTKYQELIKRFALESNKTIVKRQSKIKSLENEANLAKTILENLDKIQNEYKIEKPKSIVAEFDPFIHETKQESLPLYMEEKKDDEKPWLNNILGNID